MPTTTIKAGGQVWKPLHYTEHDGPTEGSFAINLIESVLTATTGQKAGEKIKLAEWQKWTLEQSLSTAEDGSLKYTKYLLMVPRKNGKTFIAAMLCLYHLLTGPRYGEVYSAGKDRTQASIVFTMVKDFLTESPALQKYLRYEKSKNRIVNVKTHSIFRPLSSDAGSLNGLNPTFVVADELHVWEGAGTSVRAKEFWHALGSGMGARKSAQLYIISTVGANEHGTILGGLYRKGVRISKDEEDDDSFGFAFWGAEESDDPFEESTWIKANPNLAEGLIKRSQIESELKAATATGIQGFLRMNLNIWARVEGDPFINAFYWDKSIKDDYVIPDGAEITVGFDGSQSADTTAIVIQEISTGHIEVWKIWEKDELDDSWVVSRDDVFDSLKFLDGKYDIQLAWVDASFWFPEIYKWNEHFSWHSEKVTPTSHTMVPLAQQFLQDLVEMQISHPNDEKLNEYSLRALRREDGGFGKASAKMLDRIDLLVAAILANAARNFIAMQNDEEQEFIVFRR